MIGLRLPKELGPVRRTLGFLTRRERWTYALLIAARSLSSLFDVVGIVLIGLVVGIGATQIGGPDQPPISIYGFELPRLDGGGLVILVLIVLGVFVVKALLAISVSRALTRFAARVEAKNATRLMDRLLHGSLSDLGRRSRAEYQFGLTESVGNAFTNVLIQFATIISEGLLVALIFVTFLAVNPLAAAVTCLYFGLVIALLHWGIGRRLKRAGRLATEGTIDAAAVLHDAIDGFREMSVLGRAGFFLARFAAPRRRLASNVANMAFLGGMPRYVIETALMLGVVVFVALLFISGELASGMVTLGVFLAGGVRVMGSLLPLQSALAQLHPSGEGARLAYQLLDEANAAERAPSRSTPSGSLPKDGAGLPVSITGASYTYPNAETPALSEVSLEIEAGTRVAFIGPSGAGKTTLVDLLLGLIEPTDGTVRIGGIEPTALRELAPGTLGYVPQRPGVVAGSIGENVAFGLEPEQIDADRVAEALRAAHLADFVAALPEGATTSVGKQNSALSGGQIQRLGLARALYSQPRLLVLDEATSALDATSEAFVGETLQAMRGRTTVVVIAHRLSTVRSADVVYLLEDGRITASGSFAELRRTVPTVAEFVRHMSLDD